MRSSDENLPDLATQAGSRKGRAVVYQVFTRLFGNKTTTNKPWGTIEDNGVGKFADLDAAALRGIRDLGITHVWYTGVPHHAVIHDYSSYGISHDDPDVVKGRAGSPYAVKDYYNVNPDLAEDPARRLDEFRALIDRTHRHGMQVIIDIVPNHVARHYRSPLKPDGVEDFGASDDTSVTYRRDNNFYYVVGEPFEVPAWPADYRPLGGEAHPRADGRFAESPAKWTGNGTRAARPKFDDWYETVRINYGVRPDGSRDFPPLPADFARRGIAAHAAFWRDKDVPDSWIKFRDIARFWLDLGVDGFRYDMAEMVPVEFWSYMNSAIKMHRPDAFLLAEIYNPAEYRNYLSLGKMDFLYDKVGLYDTLRAITQRRASTDEIVGIRDSLADIESHMLHFLENHDEQRIASAGFAGDADAGRPAMVVSATLGSSPTMLYFGQEVGEPGDGDAGFGAATRTSIFDYWGVPAHQRWMNEGRFDGGGLLDREKRLREFYRELMRLSASHPALTGAYAQIHTANRRAGSAYDERLFAFVRWQNDRRLIVVCNFSRDRVYSLDLLVPAPVIAAWQLSDGRIALTDRLAEAAPTTLTVAAGAGSAAITLAPLQSVIFELE